VAALFAGCVAVTTDHCTDGVFNGGESDIDCGGTCAACGAGRRCNRDSDCASGVCAQTGLCAAAAVGLPSSAGAQTYSVDPGASLIVAPGSQAGYGITANTGGTYRIVWTGEGGVTGTFNSFTGTVWTTGHFDSFTPGCSDGSCPLESNDSVGQPTAVTGGETIDFSATTSTGLDGFDFSVTVEPVYFELFVDGTHRPDLVFFSSGGQASNAGTDPFALSTQ
jgi:hypothetical protein